LNDFNSTSHSCFFILVDRDCVEDSNISAHGGPHT
jgi:hypothetical protein